MIRTSTLYVVVVLLVSACGTSAPVLVDAVDSLGDAVPDTTTGDTRFLELPGIDTTDLGFSPPGEILDANSEVTIGCAPGEGCFLDPCIDNSDCLSGWCVDHLGEGVCSQTCSEECPQGWSCQQVGASDPDLLFACVSNFANLCRPCATNADCKSVGGAEDVCIVYPGEGSFCGGPCEIAEDCPAGHQCVIAETVDGLELAQCVNMDGICPCSAKSTALKLWTSCEVSNEWGLCSGKRVCEESGLTDCDASTPAEDFCNGSDDNCDGEVDEATCDDANECTEDLCLGEEGCSNEPLEGGPCEDGDVCTVADHCDAAVCVGTPVLCDDKNPCTDDVCDITGGCDFQPNTTDCDDGDPCTVGDECLEGECAGLALACDCANDVDCLKIWDGNLCQGTLFCNQEEVPYKCQVQPGTVVDCPEPDGVDAVCLKSVCTPQNGKCSFEPDHEGFACDDGDFCTLGDKCVAGACVPGVAANCNDGNLCTDDSCNPDSGCLHAPNLEPCDDGNECTDGDICTESACTAGVPVVCDDNNVCTTDSCDAAQGCQFAPTDGDCSDGNACTIGDACQNGNCVPAGMLDCDDDDLCTDDACDIALGCLHALNENPCTDGNVCTTGDHCHLGDCISAGNLDCNDGNICTDDACEAGAGCQFAPNAEECDDGNACTPTDSCFQGTCKGSGAVDCGDDNVCTSDSCDAKDGCQSTPVAGACDDDDPCTQDDTCADGECAGTPCADLGMICQNDICVDQCVALDFDGDGDYGMADQTVGVIQQGAQEVTYETWFRPEAGAQPNAGIFGTSCKYNNLGYTADGLRLFYYRWPNACTGTTLVSADQWHHVATMADLTQDGNFSLYLDGHLECTGTAAQAMPEAAGQEKFYFGAETNDSCISEGKNPVPTKFFKGSLSALRVSDSLKYTDGFEPQTLLQVEDDTRLFYKMNEKEGLTLQDSADNGNDAQVSGATWILEAPGESCCQVDCLNKECGLDGCGGTCGTCDEGLTCVDGSCTSECFFDDFNDSNASDWQVLEGSWGFTTGKDGTPAWGANMGSYKSGRATHISLKSLQWFSIEMDFRVDWGAAGDFNLYINEVDSQDSYNVGLYPKGSDSHPDQVRKVVDGVGSQVAAHAYSIGAGQWNTMKFTRAKDGTLSVLLNGNPYMSGTDDQITGPMDLVIRFHANGFVDNVTVTCM